MNIMEEWPSHSSSTPSSSSSSESESESESKPTVVFSSSSPEESGEPALGFSGFFDLKNVSILILLIIIILTYMGINVLTIMGNLLQSFISIITPAITTFLQSVGYTTGTALNAAADVTTIVAKTGLDVADGTVHDVGNLLIGNQKGNYKINNDPQPDGSDNSIQKSMSASKTKWCLAGEYQKKRGCIDISESDKCLSGEVFPSEEMCILGKPQFQSNNT